MPNAGEKRNECLAHAADLHRRASATDNVAWKADLRDLERQWLDIAESYKVAAESAFHLARLRARAAVSQEALATKPDKLGAAAASRRQAMAEQLRQCGNLQATLDWLLDQCLKLTCAEFGNVQIMDWKAGHLEIKAQRGFHEEFLSFFRRVRYRDASACARALQHRVPIVVEDVVRDQQFIPCLKVVQRAGVRAVQSTPLVSSSGALVGIVSTHFPTPNRPTEIQMQRTKEAAQLAANAIIRFGLARTGLPLVDRISSPTAAWSELRQRDRARRSCRPKEGKHALLRAYRHRDGPHRGSFGLRLPRPAHGHESRN